MKNNTHHEHAAPVGTPFFTPGVFVLMLLMAIGFGFAAYRFVFGLSSMSNLSQAYPWGIWIAIDVASGVALAAGGFTTAALAHIFHREKYHALVRPALLTAMLGYTFVALGLLADLGRYYNIWHPIMPWMWQGNSVLFEVGMCVTIYLHVLYAEFLPIVVERFKDKVNLPGPLKGLNSPVNSLLKLLDKTLGKVMFLFIIAGVVLSCMHQSSLGALLVIAPTKVHPLWYTPILPLLFLMSAIAVGFPMVIFESMIASKAFGHKPEMHLLSPLSKIIPVILLVYLTTKVTDLAIRGAVGYLLDGSLQATMFWIEIVGGVALPMVLLLSEKVRRSPAMLFISAVLVVLGVVINRINVFLISYKPVYESQPYFPSVGEVAVTVGLISTLIFTYRLAVTIFPVLPHSAEETHS